MKMFKAQRIRDPLHDLIEFEASQFENALWNVIQTPPFQRLRRIKQLGFSDLVFPGATHSRFAHSVGVFHTARQLMHIIERHLSGSNYEPMRANEALAAALVHDLGHGPFSHSFEDVGRRLGLRLASHENVSDALIRDSEVSEALRPIGSGFANDVADVIRARGPSNLYGAVVSSQFDADRLDYMRRDRLMTGTQHSAIDFRWLISNIEVGEVSSGVDEKEIGILETFVLGQKAVYAAETYVSGLFHLYPTVYFHKTTRGAEKIFTELLVRVVSEVMDGSWRLTGLPYKHPIVQFARYPNNIKTVLGLDDTVIWGSLSLLAESNDKTIQELAARLQNRKLYKSINARERIQTLLTKGEQDKDLKAVDRTCAGVKEKISAWLESKKDGSLRILSDEAEREPYKKFQESKGPLNQVRIRAPGGELVDLGERSEIVRAIQPFKLYRLYVRDEDQEALRFIERTIEEEARNAAKA